MPVYVIDTLKPKNGLDFPIVEAIDVAVEGYLNLADAVTHFATDTAIAAINAALDLKADKTTTASLQSQIDQIAQAAGTGSADTEVAQARVGTDGTSYTTLKERLDTEMTWLSGDVSKIALDEVGYISTSGDTANLTPVYNTSYHCKVVECETGDMFTVHSQSGPSALPYAFIDSENKFILKSSAATVSYAYITAPANAVKAIFNTGYLSRVKISHGWVDTNTVFKQLDSRIATNTTEIQNARVAEDGTTYATLKERLDTELSRFSGDISHIALDTVGYISTVGDTTNFTPTSNVSYRCAVIECSEGDMFTVTSSSGSSSLPYAFVNSENEFIMKADANSVENRHIKAPAGSVKVIFNTGNIPNAKVSNGWISANSVFSELDAKISDVDSTLKSIYNTTPIAYNLRGYITNADVISLTPIDNNSYKCCYVECEEGDVFTVNATGAVAARLWMFADVDLNRLAYSDSNINHDAIVAPKNAKYLILNSTAAATTNTFKSVSIKDAVAICNKKTDAAFESCESHIDTVDDTIRNDVFLRHIENNLTSDGIGNLKGCEITLDGVTSPDNYGKSGAVYRIPIPDFKKVHIYLEWQWKEALPFESTTTKYRIAGIFNGAIAGESYVRNSGVYASSIYRTRLMNAFAANVGAYSVNFQPNYAKTDNGKPALSIRYTGERSSADDYAECIWTDSSVEFKIHSTSEIVGTVEFTQNESLYSLVNKLNAVEGITCVPVEIAGHTCGELLPVLCPNTFSMDGTYTNSNSETIYDNCFLNVPFAYDDSWHTLEIIADFDDLEGYVAFDGITQKVTISPNVKSVVANHKKLVIGESHFNIRNLIFDHGDYGDAEIVESIAYPYTAQNQMISDHNPRLIIFEGHGVDDEMEEDADHSSENMSASTDRLQYVFAMLEKRGYKPVTWQQIIDWKVNNAPLPKRCFNLMMDDYYVDNYIDYNKRIPFEKYNIKTGLAIVSDNHSMDDTLTINDKSYTISEIMRSITLAGWHPCSHTSKHYILGTKSPSEIEDILKESALSCNDHGIYSDIIVYPTGSTGNFAISALERSPFKLGINIVANRYNCKATKNHNLCRVDIGSRTPISDVISAIV